jgi:hypothetical protein
MDSVLSLLVGPLGQSFRVFKEYGILPKDMNFIEFSDELYENYYNIMGMPSGRLFLLIPIDLTGREKGEIDTLINQYIIENKKELPTVTDIEKREMLKAIELVFKTTKDLPDHSSDQERIDIFLKKFPMFE